ncbi:MAG: lipid II flippase MurJ, partial [Bradyrhizobium sp.]|nr:lipid II flippase MurJ [Bradyrhizobium sp.]
LLKFAATGLVLAVALWSTAFFAAPHLAFLGRLQDEAVLGLLIAAGAVIYAGAILALFGPRWLKALVRR